MSEFQTSELLHAHKLAVQAQSRAYAPYSHFQVGSALKVKGKDLWVQGCNVENSSYGGTVCAERISVFSAVSQHGEKDFEYIVLVTKTENGDLPCAMCLQVLSEFVGPDFPVYSANPEKIVKKFLFKELLPHPFDKQNLP